VGCVNGAKLVIYPCRRVHLVRGAPVRHRPPHRLGEPAIILYVSVYACRLFPKSFQNNQTN